MEESKAKYYAVKVGRVKGGFRSLEECKIQIDALEYLEWTDEDKINYL